MLAYLVEPFLTQYYLLDAACGNYMADETKRDMFYELARIFCLPANEELEALFADSEQEHFRKIRDLSSYQRFCRTIEYAETVGKPADISYRDRLILSQKREAMTIHEDIFQKNRNCTREMVYSTVQSNARKGGLDAMLLVSFMEYHGICVHADPEGAMKRVRICARWNSLFGNLMGIAYDPSRRQEYYDILSSFLRSAGQKPMYDHILASWDHGIIPKRHAIARILEKAFGLGSIKRNAYDQLFARVAFSGILSVEDKEKLLLRRQSDGLESLSGIPFEVDMDDAVEFDGQCIERLPILREKEVRQLQQNIHVAQTCPAEACMPLLVVSSDAYINDMYLNMLRCGFRDSALVELDAGTLTDADFAGRVGMNIFLRSLSETKSARTVFLIKDCHELSPSCTEELIKVLDVEYRKKYKLFQPALNLDLSGLVFILFASRRTGDVNRLAECCDTVRTERVKEGEKAQVVESVFRARLRVFGDPAVSMEAEAVSKLESVDSESMKKILDSALRKALFEQQGVITAADVESLSKEYITETTRKGFGYIGGKTNA